MVFNFIAERAAPEVARRAAAAPDRVVSLADLAPGAAGVVHSVDGNGAIGRRLLDLGFVPGTPLAVVRRAPLGDPVEYELRGTRLCLRRSEAARIRVLPR
jgi:ferrous iron transport protein A